MLNVRSCPVCHASIEFATLFQDENIDPDQISDFSFASRKVPEFMCHKLHRCNVCDVVYASNPPDQSELAHAYHVAEYDSSEEANDAASAYIEALQPTLKKLLLKGRALEIGSGTGILLELLKNEGFEHVVGVEPSSAAILAAPEYRRAWLKEGIFIENDFEPNSFDLICCFMTMEHVHDPEAIAQASFRLLREGGAFVTITHDYRSLVNRLLGKNSPIIDIEHMQLFSKKSIRCLFEATGFKDVLVKDFSNKYSLRYWIRLSPVPRHIKEFISSLLKTSGLDRIKVRMNVGNLIAAGKKLG
jgi:SAM-dependent methyltransferase